MAEKHALRVVVCNACALAVPEPQWQEHRSRCHALLTQLALAEELEEVVRNEELRDDVAVGLCAVVEPPPVECPHCGVGAFELCVSKRGTAMRVIHRARHDLVASRAEAGAV